MQQLLFLSITYRHCGAAAHIHKCRLLLKPVLTAHLMLLKARLTPEGCLMTGSMADGILCMPGSSAAPVQQEETR